MALVLFCFLIQLLRFRKENCILEHKHGFGRENASEGGRADLDFQL